MMITELADVCRKAGLTVVEEPGWKTRGHGSMSDVRTIACHHTANGGAKGNAPSLSVVKNGRPGLTGPLAHILLAKDGTVHIVAAGLCYHAGVVRNQDYSNVHAVGIEAEAKGVPGTKGDWPEVQMIAYAVLCKALVKHFGLIISDVRGHKEICAPVGRKSDPDFNMSTFRLKVASASLPLQKAAATPEKEPDVELNDLVSYTPSAAERVGHASDKFSTVVQFPPSVRLARDEIAALAKTQTAQGIVLTSILGAVQALAQNSPEAVAQAFDAGVAELKTELTNIDVHVTLDDEPDHKE